MRHLIKTLADTISATAIGIGLGFDVVTDFVTRGLRAPNYVRSLLVWLPGLAPAGLRTDAMCPMQAADAGATRVLEHPCASTLRSPGGRRRVKPGGGASAIGF